MVVMVLLACTFAVPVAASAQYSPQIEAQLRVLEQLLAQLMTLRDQLAALQGGSSASSQVTITEPKLEIVSSLPARGSVDVELSLPAKYNGAYVVFIANPVSPNKPASSGALLGSNYYVDTTKGGIAKAHLGLASAHEGFANNPGGVHWFSLPSGTYRITAVIYPSSPFKKGTDMEYLPIGSEPGALQIVDGKSFKLINDDEDDSDASATIDKNSLRAGTNGPTTITGRAKEVSKLFVYQVPSTYTGGLDYASIVEANKGDGALGQTAIIAYPYPSDVRNGKWSAYFGGWPSAGTYTVIVFDADSKARLATEKLVVTSAHATGSVSFNNKTYDTSTPTLTGTAKGVSAFGISIQDPGGKVYGSGSGAIKVTNGKWSHKITTALTDRDSYYVEAFDGNNKLIGSGNFVVQTEEPEESTTYDGVVAVGIYEGTYSASNPRVFQGHVEGTVNVNVTGDNGTNRTLVLSSYEPVNWVLNVQSGVEIPAIIVTGYHKSRVTNVPSGTYVTYQSYADGGKYFYAHQPSGDSYTKFNNWLKVLYPNANGELNGYFIFPGYNPSSVDVYIGWKG